MKKEVIKNLKIKRNNYVNKKEYLKAEKIDNIIKYLKEKINAIPKFYIFNTEEINNELENEYKEIKNYFYEKLSNF
jgi:hypothetical protein